LAFNRDADTGHRFGNAMRAPVNLGVRPFRKTKLDTMRRQLSILSALILLPMAALSQDVMPSPSEEEVAIGWKFWECSHFYLLSTEETQSTNAPLFLELDRLRRESHAAAIVLVGEARFKAEAADRERVFSNSFNEAAVRNGMNAIKTVSMRCKDHMEKYMSLAIPKIQALSARLAAEKRK
jgi:hypothetical protein